MEKFDVFVRDEKGEIQDQIVGVAIALILVATIGVAAWSLLANATTTNWDATVKTLVQTVIAVIAAIVVVLLLLKMAK